MESSIVQYISLYEKGKVIFCAIQMNASENILQISFYKILKIEVFLLNWRPEAANIPSKVIFCVIQRNTSENILHISF